MEISMNRNLMFKTENHSYDSSKENTNSSMK